MNRYFTFVLRHRIAVLILMGIISVASGLSLSRAVIASSVGEMFFGDSPAYLGYLERIQVFGSDEMIVMAYDDSDPLSAQSLDKLEAVVAEIATLDEVGRVTSLLDAQRIQSDPLGLKIETWAEAARAHPSERRALMDELSQDRRRSGLLLGRSHKQAAMLIELEVNPHRTGEKGPILMAGILKAFAKAGYPAHTVHRAGMPAVMAECVALTRQSLGLIFPIVLLVMLSIVTVLFRSPTPVMLAGGVSLLSVLWTLGLATATDAKLTIFESIVPAVIAIVAISDVVHLWSAYLHSLASGAEKQDAIQQSATDVGKACLLTSVTTFVGFVSLTLIPTPMFRQLGWELGFGVAMALLLAMTLVPIAATIGDTPSIKARKMDNPVARLVDGMTRICALVSTRYPRTIIIVFAVWAAIMAVGAAQSTIETSFLRRLSPDNIIRQDALVFEANFAGTRAVDVFVSTPTPEALLDPILIHQLAEYEIALEALPGVDVALSYIDLLRMIHEALGGEGELPQTRAAISQYLLLFELGGGEALDQIIDFERQNTRMAVRVNEDKMRAIHRISVQAEDLSRIHLPPEVEVEASGMLALTGAWLDNIVIGQRRGVGVSFIVITVLMCFGLGSVRIGLLSMIPNLLPLLVLVGTCGLVWTEIDSDTTVILMMAIGIGVDDTIHFLMRFRVESERTPDRDIALNNTFSFAGRAIVMTTVALALGYAPFMLSDYYSTRILGTLLPYTLCVAMLADLLLIPAFIQVGWMRYPALISGEQIENIATV
jgi:predicted RND superfamily exporter protein